MKIYFENGLNENFWKLILSINQNEKIEHYVNETFTEWISNYRKKNTLRNNLFYIFTHIFIMCEYMSHDENLRNFVFKYQYNYDFIKKTGLMLNFNRSHKVKFDYHYGEAIIKHSSLISVFDKLEELNLCKLYKGYSCPNHGYDKAVQLGFVLFKWNELYNNFFLPNKNNICVDDLVTEEHQYIVVRTKDERGNNVDVTDEYELSLFQNDIDYIKDISFMYKNMYVDLNFDNFNSVQIEMFLDEFYSKCYKAECRDESCIYSLDVESEIKYWRNKLQKISPYRVYHKNNDGLTWGRIYGVIDNLPKIYKPFLTINGKNTVGVDLKSSVVQMFILKYCSDISNLQDFYYYESLDGICEREKIKFITQCLVYNDTLSGALAAYNGKAYSEKKFSSLTKDKFMFIYDNIIKERPYLDKLLLHKDVAKDMIHEESDYMVDVSKQLLSKDVQHIYNFDCYYVTIDNLDITLDTFHNVAMNRYGRKINVDYDIELYNSFSI